MPIGRKEERSVGSGGNFLSNLSVLAVRQDIAYSAEVEKDERTLNKQGSDQRALPKMA